MTETDFQRLNQVANTIETHACEAYFAVRADHGAEVAGSLLILLLRLAQNPDKGIPAPTVIEQVKRILIEYGILKSGEDVNE